MISHRFTTGPIYIHTNASLLIQPLIKERQIIKEESVYDLVKVGAGWGNSFEISNRNIPFSYMVDLIKYTESYYKNDYCLWLGFIITYKLYIVQWF